MWNNRCGKKIEKKLHAFFVSKINICTISYEDFYYACLPAECSWAQSRFSISISTIHLKEMLILIFRNKKKEKETKEFHYRNIAKVEQRISERKPLHLRLTRRKQIPVEPMCVINVNISRLNRSKK